MVRRQKFQRQGTYAPAESEILKAIDERFEELEETRILASLVPQIHERLHALELIVRTGTWSPDSPPKEDVKLELEEGPGAVTKDLSNIDDLKKKSEKIEDISLKKVMDMDEKTLDTQTSEYYTMGESTWDLVLFIGTGALGPFGSFQTSLLAIVNILMQVVFVAIAWFNFTSPDIDDNSIRDTLRWRRSSGHSFLDYSSVAKESLVERVCKLDKSLPSSGIQVTLLENINKYLKLEATGMEGFFTGQILCIVALICWYLMVAKEVSHALALHRGVIAMPTGPTRLDTRENPFTQVVHYRLRAVAMRRKLFSGLLLLYRLLAAGLLVFVGTFFLVYTVSVTELILNAVALGIILDIDDLLFDALATTPGRHLVHQLDPLPMPSFPRIRGVDAKSVFMSISIPLLTIMVYYLMLEPMVQTLTSVKFAMCGGNQNFVWNTDKRRITHLSPTFGGGWAEEEETLRNDAIVEGERIGYGMSVADARYGVWVTDVSVLHDLEATDLDDLLEDNEDCEDLLEDGNRALLNHLRYFLQNESVQGCEDVKHLCPSFTKMPEFGLDNGRGWSIRMLCTETCGCSIPGGENINVEGCPYYDGQCKFVDKFEEFVHESVCLEQNASSLKGFPPWQSWIRSIRNYGSQPEDSELDGRKEALAVAQAMEDHGCGFEANLSAQNISVGGCFSWSNEFDWEFKTLEIFCPVSCGCSSETSEGSGCPRPFGMDCDQLSSCLTMNEKHFCPGFNAQVIRSLALYSYDTLALSHVEDYIHALQKAFAQVLQIDPGTVRAEESSPGTAALEVFVLDETADVANLTSDIYSTPLEVYQNAWDQQLQLSNLPNLGLNLSFAGPESSGTRQNRQLAARKRRSGKGVRRSKRALKR